MMPSASNLALMSGELSALAVSADMRRTMSLGAADCVKNNTQVEPSMAGPPDSLMVGSSGAPGTRCD